MMRRLLTAAAAVILTVGAGEAADSPEAEVRKAQEARFAATIKGDLVALGPMLAEDMTYGHSSSKLETKREFLELVKTGFYQYKSIAPREVAVRTYGDDTALVNGLADVDVVSGGNPLSIKLRFLEVWVRRSGRWQLAAWQSVRLPAN